MRGIWRCRIIQIFTQRFKLFRRKESQGVLNVVPGDIAPISCFGFSNFNGLVDGFKNSSGVQSAGMRAYSARVASLIVELYLPTLCACSGNLMSQIFRYLQQQSIKFMRE